MCVYSSCSKEGVLRSLLSIADVAELVDLPAGRQARTHPNEQYVYRLRAPQHKKKIPLRWLYEESEEKAQSTHQRAGEEYTTS